MSLLAAHHSCCGVGSRGQESQGQEVGQGQERCETLEQRILLSSCCWRMNNDYGSLMLSTIAIALDIVISSTITSIIVTTVIAGEVVIVIIVVVSIGVAGHWKISLL